MRRLLFLCMVATGCDGTILAAGDVVTETPTRPPPSGAGGGTTRPVDPVGGGDHEPMCPPAESQDVGRVTMRRLNRAEYNNTVRDLLGTTTRPADDFPADDYGHGFNNNGDVLTTAPVLVEKYDLAAKALAEAVVTRESSSGQTTRTEAELATTSTGSAAGSFWNLFTNGTITAPITFTSTGRYTFRVRAAQQAAGPDAANMTLSLDGRQLSSFTVSALEAAPNTYSVEADVTTQGMHTVVVAFTNDYYQAPNDRNLLVDWIEVQKPGSVVDPATAKVMVCDPATAGCSRTILSRFGRKAWRRPLTTDEVSRYERVVTLAIAEGETPKAGLVLALEAMLLSPHFLFRVELDSVPTSLDAHPLSAHELAARVSYFLWASTPDDTLSAVADDGSLTQPAVLEAQVTRMLRDPKARTLVTNFGGQWLWSNQVEDTAPLAAVYPNVTAATKTAMRQETEAFFEHFLVNDVSALGLLGSDFTFLNDTLADHYGLPRPGSATMQRVTLGTPVRGSILGQAGLLTVTSLPARTSPVKRGAWVMTNLMCQEPPAPPPGVEALPVPTMPNASLRQRMEAHRSNPTCAGCHSMMDPIGFGMEPFDGVGRTRTTDTGGFPIDASGALPDGRTFNGPAELSTLLKAEPRVTLCMTEKLFTYGLGRAPTREEACQVDGINAAFEQRGHRLSGLVKSLVASRSFTHRRGELP